MYLTAVIQTIIMNHMMFWLLPHVMKGTHGKFKQTKMGVMKTFSMHSNRPLYIHLDGEVFTNFSSNLHGLKFEILPDALKVIRG